MISILYQKKDYFTMVNKYLKENYFQKNKNLRKLILYSIINSLKYILQVRK